MKPPEVMLAKGEMTKPVEFYADWLIQEKTDGIRALVIKQGNECRIFGRNQTRQGRAEFTKSLPEVVAFFNQIPDSFIIDCELMSKDFLALQSKVRTTKTVITDPHFYLKMFDILTWNDWNYVAERVVHTDRYEMMVEFRTSVLNEIGQNGPMDEAARFFRLIVQAPQPLTDEAYLNQCLQKVVDRGGEGLIIKNPKGIYQPGKRSPDWIKVLPYRELDVMFYDLIRGEGKYAHTLGALCAVPLADYARTGTLERQFTVGTGWNDELRNRIWKAGHQKGFFPVPGKITFKELYPSGIPRMPVFLSFNADKEAS
jgi:bifunctional non-homologous end joining protein LigD